MRVGRGEVICPSTCDQYVGRRASMATQKQGDSIEYGA